MNKPKGRERLIFPLDLPSYEEAERYVELLNGHVGIFKVGLELFVKSGEAILETIKKKSEAEIFLDLKFLDIPATVGRATGVADELGVKFLTVHCDPCLKKAAENAPKGTKILGVTVLTSASADDLKTMGLTPELCDPKKLVMHRAKMAKAYGAAGIVCSGEEVEDIRKEFGKDFLTIVPGIRPTWSVVKGDDQSRITTPAQAISRGADYIVVGRPIRDAADPAEAADRIAEEIGSVL